MREPFEYFFSTWNFALYLHDQEGKIRNFEHRYFSDFSYFLEDYLSLVVLQLIYSSYLGALEEIMMPF